MRQALNPTSDDTVYNTIQRFKGDDAKVLSVLYDAHAAVVLGLLSRMVDEKEKAEELLQAVFLVLPSRIEEFDPSKGRLVSWVLRLARSVAHTAINGGNDRTNDAIQSAPQSVLIKRPVTDRRSDGEQSLMELLYVKGYTFGQAAAELGIEEHAVKLLVRTELKTYRFANKDNPNA